MEQREPGFGPGKDWRKTFGIGVMLIVAGLLIFALPGFVRLVFVGVGVVCLAIGNARGEAQAEEQRQVAAAEPWTDDDLTARILGALGITRDELAANARGVATPEQLASLERRLGPIRLTRIRSAAGPVALDVVRPSDNRPPQYLARTKGLSFDLGDERPLKALKRAARYRIYFAD
ncbi:MAG TPA: hypothetical protein VGE07_01465, partial [Herpetosiphonaceae bacterium]